jgi:hypothetical protein
MEDWKLKNGACGCRFPSLLMRSRIRIRIKVKSWIRIRIKMISWIRIRSKVNSWIRIRFKVDSWIPLLLFYLRLVNTCGRDLDDPVPGCGLE